MPTIDFVPFCPTDTGTNLVEQAAYLTDPQLPIGNQPGVARSQLVNKALRQATYMGASLANFLANATGNNVLDDATMSEVLATMALIWPSRTTAFTPAWAATTTAPTLGSTSINKGFQRRVADMLEIDVYYDIGTGGTSPTTGTGTYLMTLPSSLAIDSTKIGNISTNSVSTPYPSRVGGGLIISTTSASFVFGAYAYSTTQLAFNLDSSGLASISFGSAATPFANIQMISFKAQVPIVGW